MTFYVLEVTIPCICDKNKDVKLCPGKGESTGVLLGFCCGLVAEVWVKHCSVHDSLSNSKKLQSQMHI